MPLIGYHASHEQLSPAALLDAVRDAEAAGFTAAMCSDHFAPWGEAQGHSGHSWSWLGAALEATSLTFGVVTAPVQRYHPAVVAQAVATLAEMYPGRFWAALGSGEALNEHITGEPWPRKEIRDARLLEAVDVIRRLHAGEEVSVDGHVKVDRARVWSLPEEPPPLIGAAVSEETARTVGGWADGLITVNQPVETLERVVEAFRDEAGAKPVYLQVHLSWADSEERALEIAYEQWKTNVFGSALAWNLETTGQFDEAARSVRPEDVRQSVLVSSDVDQHISWLAEYADIGFDGIYLHHVGQEQAEFIRVFGERVIPAFNT
ncbi:MAG: TIGR03885 family FMN-dependent LLM class oxidoreductase [Actinomycetota bacterium]